MIAFRGVRISWLVLARKLDFAATAASAAAFARISARLASCVSVTSRACTIVAGHPIASMGTFVNESSMRRRLSRKSASISSVGTTATPRFIHRSSHSSSSWSCAPSAPRVASSAVDSNEASVWNDG